MVLKGSEEYRAAETAVAGAATLGEGCVRSSTLAPGRKVPTSAAGHPRFGPQHLEQVVEILSLPWTRREVRRLAGVGHRRDAERRRKHG